MNSFLHRLALREHGALTVLNPRLPGWYEPSDVQAPLPAAARATPAGEDMRQAPVWPPVPAAAAAAAGLRAASTRQAYGAPNTGQSGPDWPADMRPAATAAPAPVLGSGLATAAAGAAPPGAAMPAAAPLSPLQARALSRPAMLGAAPGQPVRPTAEPDPGSRAASVSAGPAGGPAQSLRAASAPRATRATDADADNIVPARRAAAALSASLPPSAAAAIQAARASDRTATAPMPPVVQVTIGRVEVRAASSAPAPARHASRQQPTSLDDYLRKREGRQ